jgi:hypothetical protein
VNLSYYWLAPIVLGASGLMARAIVPHKNPWPRALAAAAGAVLLLLLFFAVAWPSL